MAETPEPTDAEQPPDPVQRLVAKSAALLAQAEKLARKGDVRSARLYELHQRSDELLREMAALASQLRLGRKWPPDAS